MGPLRTTLLLLGATAALGAAVPGEAPVAGAFDRVMASAIAEAARFDTPGGAFAIVDERRVFVWARERTGAAGGMKFDRSDTFFAAGPGGVYLFASDGTHEGTIMLSVPTSNSAFGADGNDLPITADTSIDRLRFSRKAAGAAPRIGG